MNLTYLAADLCVFNTATDHSNDFDSEEDEQQMIGFYCRCSRLQATEV